MLQLPGAPQLLLFGGTAGAGLLFNDLFVYDVQSNVWTQFPHRGRPPCARYGHSMCMTSLIQPGNEVRVFEIFSVWRDSYVH